MRKFMLLAAGFMAAAVILLSTGAAVGTEKEFPKDASEQVILRLLHQSVREAVGNYYGESKQYWREEILGVQKVPQSPYYEVIIRLETFCGAHNPPYGLETLTFYVGPIDGIQLIRFDHQDESD